MWWRGTILASFGRSFRRACSSTALQRGVSHDWRIRHRGGWQEKARAKIGACEREARRPAR